MPVGGRDRKLTRTTWFKLARYSQLQPRAAKRVIDDQIEALPEALAIIDRSYLDPSMHQTLKELLQTRTAILKTSEVSG